MLIILLALIMLVVLLYTVVLVGLILITDTALSRSEITKNTIYVHTGMFVIVNVPVIAIFSKILLPVHILTIIYCTICTAHGH